MSIEVLTVLLFASLLLVMTTGIPLCFALGGIALIFTYFLWGQDALYMIATTISSVQLAIVLICAPLFIFMGNVLEGGGIADYLFATMHRWFGPVNGGLAMGAVLVCTIFAAMCGISAAGTITMGLIALPAMLKRNYNKNIALGSILAGGALGILIPPSVTMVFFGFLANCSIGQLFIGGVFPGLMLSSFYIIYIGLRCWLQPHLGPAISHEERVGWLEKFRLLRSLILPVILVIMVLGSIFLGLCSPTEAGAVGALGSLICVAINRKLSWKLLKESCYKTIKLSCMCMWIMIGAKCFTVIYAAIGGQQLATNIITGLEVNRYVVLAVIMLTYFFLGMILDPIGILMLTTPIFVPVVLMLGFNVIWFGVLYIVNMEMAYITPPFGWNLFMLKGVAPGGVTLGDIYRSVWPFVLLQAVCLTIIIVFPQIVLWLPSLMIG